MQPQLVAEPVRANGAVTQADLAAEVDRLRQLNRMRTQFVNTAAHEFATPLTPLRLQIVMLRDGVFGDLNEQQRASVDTLARNIERLSHLVTDVLDVARIEANRFLIHHTDVDLADLARAAVASFQESARQHRIRLEVKTPERLEIQADPDRITQVFVNLISNALKFTRPGGEVKVVVEQPVSDRVLVRVADSGVGIKPEEFPKLFQPFSQLGNGHETTQQNGSGLGLSICQGIIQQHGGRIWVDSSGPDTGTTFTFTLPTEPPPETAEAAGIVVMPKSQIRRLVQRSGWSLFCFKCPDCGSRDIEFRLLRNRYECSGCGNMWR